MDDQIKTPGLNAFLQSNADKVVPFERVQEIPRQPEPATTQGQEQKEVDFLAGFIDPTTLEGIEPPDREWIVQDWLPVGCVTSLYGGAGYGKTLVAQMLQTAAATGKAFLGLETTQCN